MTSAVNWHFLGQLLISDHRWHQIKDSSTGQGWGMNLFTRDSHYKKKMVAWKWLSGGATNYARNIISWNTFLLIKLEEQAKDNTMTACRFLKKGKKKGKNGDSLVQRININCRRNTSRGILLLKKYYIHEFEFYFIFPIFG